MPDLVTTVAETLDQAVSRLQEAGCATPELDAEVLLAAALCWTRAKLLAERRALVGSLDRARFATMLERRVAREPLSYILGEREFWSLSFVVDYRVLVPRPETELVVEVGLRAVRWLSALSAPILVVDVGTGSGAIVIALGDELGRESAPRRIKLIALDIDSAALEVARANAARCATTGPQIDFLLGDLTTALAPGTVDVVVTNPPYLRASDWAADPRSAELRFEPPLALVGGGADGLAVFRRLIDDAARVLREGGVLVSEIGAGQGDPAVAIACRSGFDAALVLPDLAGQDRVVVARRG